MHCERSGWENTGLRIARELGLNYVFLCEFEELYSPLRDLTAQVRLPLAKKCGVCLVSDICVHYAFWQPDSTAALCVGHAACWAGCVLGQAACWAGCVLASC